MIGCELLDYGKFSHEFCKVLRRGLHRKHGPPGHAGLDNKPVRKLATDMPTRYTPIHYSSLTDSHGCGSVDSTENLLRTRVLLIEPLVQ